MESNKQIFALIGAVVAIVGAIVTIGTFGFALLQGAQDTRRKGAEFKTELIDRVTRVASDTIVAGRQIIGGSLPQARGDPQTQVEQKAFLQARRDWWQTRYSVAATLAATYSDDALKGEWTQFATAVDNYLRLSVPLGGKRSARDNTVDELQDYFGAEAAAEFEALRKWTPKRCQRNQEDSADQDRGLPGSGAAPGTSPTVCPYNGDYFFVSYRLFDRLDELSERLSSADLTLY
jgi:hypothetical protein